MRRPALAAQRERVGVEDVEELPAQLLLPRVRSDPVGERVPHRCAKSGSRMTPVGGSSSAGRYRRCTATRTRLGDGVAERRVGQPRRVAGVRDVPELEADRGHAGQPQHLPRLLVHPAVEQVGAGDDLALHQRGELLADGRGGAAARAEVVGRDAVAACGGGPVDVQRQHQVGARLVGELRPLGVAGAAVRSAGQQGADADGGEASLEAGGQVDGDRGLLQAVAGRPAVAAAVAGVEDDDLARQRGARAVQRLGLAQRLRPPAGDVPAELLSARSVAGPQVPSAHQAVLALQPLERLLGERTEDAVGAAGVVAELEQPLLQRGDVVTDEHPRREGQDAVAEPPAGGGQGAVGLGADDAVDRQPAVLLEVPQRPVGRLVEDRVGGRLREQARPAGPGRPGWPARRRRRRRGPRGGTAARAVLSRCGRTETSPGRAAGRARAGSPACVRAPVRVVRLPRGRTPGP